VARLTFRDSAAVGEMAKRVGKGRHPAQRGGLVHHGTVLDAPTTTGIFRSTQRQVYAPDAQSVLPGMLRIRPWLDREHFLRRGVFRPHQTVRLRRDQGRPSRPRPARSPPIFITKGIRCTAFVRAHRTRPMLNRAAAAGPGGRDMFVSRHRWDGSERRKKSLARSLSCQRRKARLLQASRTSSMRLDA